MERLNYVKWLRFYLDFFAKYLPLPRDPGSLEPFLQKLAFPTGFPSVGRASAITSFWSFLNRPGPKRSPRPRGDPEAITERTDEVVRQIIRYRFLDPDSSPEVIAQ